MEVESGRKHGLGIEAVWYQLSVVFVIHSLLELR